jgi:hypothetical protein
MYGDIALQKAKRLPGICSLLCWKNTEMSLKKMGCGDFVTNYLLRFMIKRIDFVNTVRAFELLKSRETPLLDQELSGFLEGLCLCC